MVPPLCSCKMSFIEPLPPLSRKIGGETVPNHDVKIRPLLIKLASMCVIH